MSADAAPRVHRTPIQLRFSDTDALGHVNNASFAVYAELGRLAFMNEMGGIVRSIILAHLSIDFRRQVELGATVEVTTSVARLGTTSVTLQQTIWADGAPAAEVRSVVVVFDYATQSPAPVPDAVRALLADYLSPEAQPGG